MSNDSPPGSPGIYLRIPAEIGPRLLADAAAGACTVQAVILRIVGEHYAVSVPPPLRGGDQRSEARRKAAKKRQPPAARKSR